MESTTKNISEKKRDCEHVTEMMNSYTIVCVKCAEVLQEHLFVNYNYHLYNSRRRSTLQHCTRKYFMKILERYIFAESFNESVLMYDFDEQESALKDILTNENRKNSLNAHYKLHKLLQHQGFTYILNIPKCSKVLAEHDRIMKLVWEKLEWIWIDT